MSKEETIDQRLAREAQIRQAITPNTGSRELDEIIKAIFRYEVPITKSEAKQAILAYTANKQRELLVWVHDNRHRKDFHEQLDAKLEDLRPKNKKESLS